MIARYGAARSVRVPWHVYDVMRHECAHATVMAALGHRWSVIRVSPSSGGRVFPAEELPARDRALIDLAGPVYSVWGVYDLGRSGLAPAHRMLAYPRPGFCGRDIDNYARNRFGPDSVEGFPGKEHAESTDEDLRAVVELLRKHQPEWDRLVAIIAGLELDEHGYFTLRWEDTFPESA